MTASFAIQTHPSRAELCVTLATAIGGPVEIVTDPEPNSGLRSPWRTYRRALETTPADATNRLIIQDDAIVCQGFREAATRAIEAFPDHVIVFFVGGNPPTYANLVRAACYNDRPYAKLPNTSWLPTVATSWPAAIIPEFLSFVDDQKWPVGFRADDEIAGRFLRESKHPILATVPSLVQHPDTAQSLVGRRNMGGADRGRVAACWIGDCDNCDALAIDWSAGP